jgi:hypothetical protein
MGRDKDWNNLPFEFLFKINGNIVVGRNFWVKDFNNESLKSIDVKYMIDEVVDILHKDFLKKTENYLYKYYDPYAEREEVEEQLANSERDIFETEDVYQVDVLYQNKVFISKQFTANNYPPKVRYDVNIRKIIPKIIKTIQITLSQKNYTKEYAGISL